jgi:hypothetical protein
MKLPKVSVKTAILALWASVFVSFSLIWSAVFGYVQEHYLVITVVCILQIQCTFLTKCVLVSHNVNFQTKLLNVWKFLPNMQTNWKLFKIWQHKSLAYLWCIG